MSVRVITIPYNRDNYAFLILSETPEKFSVLVDAGSASEIISELENQADYPCKAILITHFHADHIEGLREIIEFTRFPDVFGHKNTNIKIPNYTAVSPYGVFEVQKLIVKAYECKSHCADHLAFHVLDALFCGDILFSAGCGRFFSGNGADLLGFINILNTLPDSTTKMYFGHEYTLTNLKFALDMEPNNPYIKEYMDSIKNQPAPVRTVPSTLSLEKKVNPFLRYNEPEILNHPAVKKHADNSRHVIEALRHIRDRY